MWWWSRSTTGSACSASCAARGVCGDALDSTGNESVLDQIAALGWVRDEIGGFGGDPHNVTVFGQSAWRPQRGAADDHAAGAWPGAQGHPAERRLRVVGRPQQPASSGGTDREATRLLLDAAGLSPAEAGQLRDWPAAALLDLQQRVTPRTGGVFYRPVADGDLIPADPFAAVAAGASRGIPLLCGTNLDEMKFFRAMDPAVDTLDEAGLLARCRALRPGAGQAERVIETYRAARQARGADTSPPELWFAIAGDQAYRASASCGRPSCTPPTRRRPMPTSLPGARRRGGAGWARPTRMEIPFVFGRLDDPGMGPLTGQGDAVQRLSGQMMDAWIAFARTGTPGDGGAACLAGLHGRPSRHHGVRRVRERGRRAAGGRARRLGVGVGGAADNGHVIGGRLRKRNITHVKPLAEATTA